MDFTEFTNEDLAELRIAVLSETERRADLARLPSEIAAMATKYLDGGGDETTLTNALSGQTEGDDDDVDTGG